MLDKITIRPIDHGDAGRFFEILSSERFLYFVRPESLEEEKEYLKSVKLKEESGIVCPYTILCGDGIIGGVSIKINPHRPYEGEIGYFVDEAYWGKGVATEAVKLMEKIGFEEKGLKRIEILMRPENAASERVAIKCGYIKECISRKVIMDRDGSMRDACVYAKVI